MHAIFVLRVRDRDGIQVASASPGAAFRMLCRHTYRRKYIHGMRRLPDHFRAVSALARQVPVASLTRPLHPVPPDRLADMIERRLSAVGTTPADLAGAALAGAPAHARSPGEHGSG